MSHSGSPPTGRTVDLTLVNPWAIEDGEVVLDADDLHACVDSLHVTELEPLR